MYATRHPRLALTVFIATAAVLVQVGPFGASAIAAPPDGADALQIFNRDVYFLDGATLRNPTAETAPDDPLYNVVGVGMETTWGEWSAVTATSRAQTVGTGTHVRIQLAGLVPGGLYSIFWGTLQPDSEHPGCPGVERTLPLDAFPPDASAPAPNAW